MGSQTAVQRVRARVEHRRRWDRRTVARTTLSATVLLLLVVTLVVSVAMFAAERDVNEQVTTYLDSLFWTVSAMVGRLQWFPVSATGRAVDVTLLFLRPGLLGVVTATLTAGILQLILRRDAGTGRVKMEDHLVICGWSSKADEIVDEIIGRAHDQPPRIVVLASLGSDPVGYEQVRFVAGDPTDVADLDRASIGTAAAAIVLADDVGNASAGDRDARSLLTTLAIESMNPACYTVVEVLRSSNRVHFDRTNADELVVSGMLTGGLLAHSAVTNGLSAVIADLVMSPEGNEFTWRDVDDDLVGLTYLDALARLKTEHDQLALAVQPADGPVETNPAADRVLAAGDRVLVISPDLGVPPPLLRGRRG